MLRSQKISIVPCSEIHQFAEQFFGEEGLREVLSEQLGEVGYWSFGDTMHTLVGNFEFTATLRGFLEESLESKKEMIPVFINKLESILSRTKNGTYVDLEN